ncbi:UPF0280 family protein [Sulfitobacter aestuarii]|uniref:UPF0280 family protein n=1 Tax=Sulfitobacter aestuarii TaxID=2161676 RepID=A0ABW5TWY2_9RHOB
MTPQAALLPGDRLHLQHGPIDLIIGAEGQRARAFAAARDRFESVLSELTAELDLLRQPVGRVLQGGIARRMYDAAMPHADGHTTPMIAVAGAVAEEVLAAMSDAADLTRAYVNNGGDIALHLTRDTRFLIAMAAPDGSDLGRVGIAAADPVRGIATSGRQGRSLSLGIAESVTVLAGGAAQADAAATLIGNAVDLPGHRLIARLPANEVQPDSDLGPTPVVQYVGRLSEVEISQALAPGETLARQMIARGQINAAALFLRGQSRIVTSNPSLIRQKEPIYA